MAEITEHNKLAHPSFPQPPDTSVTIWRYMDLPKLIWTISKCKIYLSRVDLLDDPHEGSTPKLSARVRDEFLRNQGVSQFHIEQFTQINRNNRASCYVNCWRQGNAESEAMWRLYCPSGHGVAIQTTYQRLVNSIVHESALYIGLVTYIDYETQGFRQDNMFNSIMHKRISFAHEQEVRLVKTLPDYWGLPLRIGPPGITIDWSIESVIDGIFVDPYAPEWFFEVTCATVRAFAPALEEKVHWSRMRGVPVF